MTQVQVLDTSLDRSGGYRVDVGRGQRIGRVSSEWFSRPADERYLSLNQLMAAVNGRAERIRRFLLHVLPKGFHRIRHYGLLAGATRKSALDHVRQLLGVAPPAPADVRNEPDDTRPPCPCCGGHMVIIETFERQRQPRAPPAPASLPGTHTP